MTAHQGPLPGLRATPTTLGNITTGTLGTTNPWHEVAAGGQRRRCDAPDGLHRWSEA